MIWSEESVESSANNLRYDSSISYSTVYYEIVMKVQADETWQLLKAKPIK